ncbi:MAG: hypothetical protein JWM78_150 [Verrucomicrobiaceae bacterium]|nr:hypothetical protein [Verrucomicrobiaceae bacterium]
MSVRIGKRSTINLLALLVINSALINCGGGGGSASTPPPNNSTPAYGLTVAPAAVMLQFPSTNGSNAIQLNQLASGFSSPVLMVSIPASGGRNAVVEQRGTVALLDANFTAQGALLNISAQTLNSGEQGLLGLAFDPNIASNGYFYVDYISSKTAGRCAQATDPRCTRISRFTLNKDANNNFVYTTVNNSSEKVLLEISQPFENHKGGMLAFGPDNYLYIAMGDGGSGGDPNGNAQNLGVLLGKILRIDPRSGDPYAIPPSNPFINTAGARPEIWAYGLRNPWRFSFDRQTGKLWAGDVGQNLYEEIDIVTGGGNYGWNAREGKHAYNIAVTAQNAIEPVWEYDHTAGQSITGGYVYRGNAIPALRGQYIYTDFGSGTIWALDSVNFTNQALASSGLSIGGFGEDANGEIYALDYSGGRLLRIDASTVSGATMPTHLSETGLFAAPVAQLQAATGLIEYDVNTPLWSDGANKRRWIALPANGKITFSATDAWQLPVGSVVVKHFAVALDQRQPSQLHNLETRVLIHESSGWAGYTYRWNAQQTDADLLTVGATENLNLIDGSGAAVTREYEYPSSAQCHSCHTDAAGTLLGVRTRQLNRNFNYGAVTDTQLRSFNHIALFSTDIGDAAQYGASAALDNASAGVEQRARDYLDANCSQCHRPGGGTGVAIDLRSGTANSAINAIDIAPSAGDLGVANARIVAPGSKERSVLWQRMRLTDPAAGRMPPLASHAIDDAAVALIDQWIDGLP